MVSVININNRIKEPTHGYQKCNTSQKLILRGILRVRESLNTRVIIWINSILNHIDTRVESLRHEGSCILSHMLILG